MTSSRVWVVTPCVFVVVTPCVFVVVKPCVFVVVYRQFGTARRSTQKTEDFIRRSSKSKNERLKKK